MDSYIKFHVNAFMVFLGGGDVIDPRNGLPIGSLTVCDAPLQGASVGAATSVPPSPPQAKRNGLATALCQHKGEVNYSIPRPFRLTFGFGSAEI